MGYEGSPYFTKRVKKMKTTGKEYFTYDPREIYDFLFTNTDRSGRLIHTLPELAEAAKLDKKYLTSMVNDFEYLGLVEFEGPTVTRQVKMLYPTDLIDWEDEEFQDRIALLRSLSRRDKKTKQLKEKMINDGLI